MNETEMAAGLAPTPGYQYASQVGDELVVAGQVPLDSRGELIAPGDGRTQAIACLDNLKALLDVHRFDRGDVQHLRIFVVGDRDCLVDVWEAVLGWWSGEVPPATLLGVAQLGYDEQVVEVEARVIRQA